MKKLFVFLTALLGVTSLSLTLNPDFDRVSADTKDGYVMCGEGTAKEDYFKIITNSPWEDGAKWEISLLSSQPIDKSYIVIDFDVTSSLNNPELVARLGLNGTYFTGIGTDGQYYHGSTGNVMKNWGDWFFLPPGRNQVYLPVSVFASSVSNIEKFSIFFDTGFDNRSGSSINIYGLYQANTYEEELTTNYILPSNYGTHPEKITTVGVTATTEIHDVAKEIQGAYLFGDYVGALNIHVKSSAEGGKVIDKENANDDYGYLTIALNEAVDITNDEGLAFSVYALKGLTFFRISLEDEDGHFFAPALFGGKQSDAQTFPMICDSVLMTITHFYAAIFMEEKDNGTVYIPYDSFEGQSRMFEQDHPVQATRITNIKKIHIGLDMQYGLGRNLVVNEFGTCDAETETVKSLVQLSKLNETEWNRDNFNSSTRVSVNNSEAHKNNFIFRAISESEIPGAKEPIDITSLNRAIELAKSLNKEDYTSETWEVLEVKLENAENFATYSDLYEQDDINDATSDLLMAIRKLEFKVKKQGIKPLYIALIVAAGVTGVAILVFGTLAIVGLAIGGSAVAVFTGKRKKKNNKVEGGNEQ